ncbi:uncharacterized protein PFL1_01426 [Pseudozyma flocculosa PF-1]|uniref:BZIP domain-containing protein n=1 Tax=Pseudozyma flocculosa TaxID=84751 RepID=A0A5C3EZ08_9BASI|nr:uncharacterized protein PFL1_01426 [Pseudozyma flocculosa PF-1]EPQ31241.1 hypothetical protein PFL1_01426 [Pseudozyma flocculosa PF-1]SPO36261.1 uncharacterized protein PSFLO_01732 [Pseudozyma flocculosa]
MAATQVARNNSFNGFDEFVNLPSSPALTPRLQPTKPAQMAANATNGGPSSSTAAANTGAASASASTPAINMRTVGLDENQPPPPPGSSPEALFRYYLAAELRKAGTRPDEALLDRYVKNHFDSLFKNKQPATASASTSNAVPKPAPTPRAISVKPSSSSSAPEPIALQRLPVPRKSPAVPTPAVTPRSAPEAGPSSQPAPVARDRADSPPELQAPDSPSASAKSFSPLSTPPALAAVDEIEELDFTKGFKQSEATFDGAALDSFGFVDGSDLGSRAFRASAFNREADEPFSIDPHMMQMDTASSLELLGSTSKGAPVAAAPQCDVSAMSEDGLSDLEEEDSKEKLAGLLEHHKQQQQLGFYGSQASGSNAGDSRDSTPATGSGSTPSAMSRVAAFPNDAKPDPEEYKKLSSKEKRQLRNKISARNFRTRRKEYITHLEEQVADRDSIIEGLRQQLSQVTMEKASLQEEVRTLKARTISQNDVGKILEALQKNLSPGNSTLTVAPPQQPAAQAGFDSATNAGSGTPLTPSAFFSFADGSRPSTPTSIASFGSASAGAAANCVPGSPRASSPRPSLLRRSSPSLIAQPNTKKDVGPQSSFWGGVGGAAGQSFTPVC